MQIMAQFAGHFFDPEENADKIWAATYTDTGDYVAVWGRRGNRNYQSQTIHFGRAGLAQTHFERMVRQKTGKHYRSVPFDDPNWGNIPSFSRTLSGTGTGPAGAGTGKITGPTLLTRLRQLARRIETGFEPDRVLVEWGQLKAASGLVLENAGHKASTSAADLAPAHARAEVEVEVEVEVEAEPFDPGELEAALNEVSRSVRLALLA